METEYLEKRLPCKIGDKYYEIEKQYFIDSNKCKGCRHYFHNNIENICLYLGAFEPCVQLVEKTFKDIDTIVSSVDSIGKTIFIGENRKKQAELKLKKIKGQNSK